MPNQSPFIAEESATADSLAEWSGQFPLWDPATSRVTFLYHAESDPQAVHLNINRITDKSNFEVGLIRRVSGTRWWIRTLELAPTVCASYGFCEYADAAEARPAPRGLLPASL